MSDEINTCARCGGQGRTVVSRADHTQPVLWLVECYHCDNEGPEEATASAAIAAWNDQTERVKYE